MTRSRGVEVTEEIRFSSVSPSLAMHTRTLQTIPMRVAVLLLLPPFTGCSLILQQPTTLGTGSIRPPLRSAPPGSLLPATAPGAATAPLSAIIADMHLRPALRPILFIIGGSLLGTLPSGLKAFWPVRTEEARQKQLLMRRVFTGCMLGVTVSLWIFSGTWGYLSAFALMAIIAQNEYFFMAQYSGCYPAWKLGTASSCGLYAAAMSSNPVLRDALFPLTGVLITVYLLLRRSIIPAPHAESPTPPLTMNDVSTTFLGIYYFGFMP